VSGSQSAVSEVSAFTLGPVAPSKPWGTLTVPARIASLTSARATVELPVVADARIPQGVAFLPANRAGAGIGDLVDPDAAVTDLRVETLR